MACNVLVINELYKKVLLSAYCVSEGSIFFFFGGVIFFLFSLIHPGTFLHSGKFDERKKEMEGRKTMRKRSHKKGYKSLTKT